MIKPINMLKNPEQAKILRAKAETVVGMPDHVMQLINDLRDTAASNPLCIGLASNQIWDQSGLPPAVFVVKTIQGIFAVVNPVVETPWKKEIKDNEGCMSVPGLKKAVRRPRHLRLSFYDENGKFNKDIHFFDDIARIIMHEYDHLQGELIEDK